MKKHNANNANFMLIMRTANRREPEKEGGGRAEGSNRGGNQGSNRGGNRVNS